MRERGHAATGLRRGELSVAGGLPSWQDRDPDGNTFVLSSN